MSFQPQPGDTIIIHDTEYRFGEHPAAPGLVYAQAGRQGVIYQLLPPQGNAAEAKALKVFNPKYRIPSMVYQSELLESYSVLAGLRVCSRLVLTPEKNGGLIHQHTDLLYAVAMPWIYGPTWLDIVAERRMLTRKQSLLIAKSLARICSGMEQRGLAHCDLSAPNIMLPFFSEVKQNANASPIQLVDVEQLYSPKLDRPDVLFSGSPGYAAHRTLLSGMWSAYADRFAGSILLAEMLGWSSPQIVEKSWGESYFDQREMQTSCDRYEVLKRELQKLYGNKVAELLARAWASQDLSSCPTFGEWLIVLSGIDEDEQMAVDAPPHAQQKDGTEALSDSEQSMPMTAGLDNAVHLAAHMEKDEVAAASARDEADPDIVNRLFRQARELEERNQLQGALEVYRSAHHFVVDGSPMQIELSAAIADLERKLSAEAQQKSGTKGKLGKRTIAMICIASTIVIIGCGAIVASIMNANAAKRAAEEQALLEAKQLELKNQQLKAEEEQKQEEAKQREEEQRKEEARKQEEQKRKAEKQRAEQLEAQKKEAAEKEAERKRLQAKYDKQAQYEKYLAWKKERDEKLRIEQAREQERKRLEAEQAAKKAAELKKIRNRDVVLLIASYNKTYNSIKQDNMKNAKTYALEFIERYEKDPNYFKNVGKVGTRAAHIYKFLQDTSYKIPDI